MIPYVVCEFSKPTLSNLVKECFGSYFPDILEKRQVGYIYRYLNDLGAKSILLEFEYIDRDYLEDYSRYYVRSFGNNGHKCARLHFFSEEIDHSRLNNILITGAEEGIKKLQSAYLGYMVIKPLPKTFVGRTCLKNYPSFNAANESKKCLCRKYEVDLFGIPLQVDSIAFQEQDQVVSACATTAIWTALHALPQRSVREMPACSIITTHAINHIVGSSNSFPNRGLSNVQILRSLDTEGLRHHEINIQTQDKAQTETKENFIEIVKYHINSGLPLILGIDVYSYTEKDMKWMGGHAVTILGYSISKNEYSIYVHDDRMGPFAKAVVVDISHSNLDKNLNGKWGLSLQEKDDSGKCEAVKEYLLPTSLIIPAPQKARLNFSYTKITCDWIVREYVKEINEVIEQDKQIQNELLSFDIELMEISKLRQLLIRREYPLSEANNSSDSLEHAMRCRWEEQKKKFLTGSYARYQWVASFKLLNKDAFKILIDATDIPQGDAISFVFIENYKVAEAVLTVFDKFSSKVEKIPHLENNHFYASFLRCLKKDTSDRSKYLDETYGELRAPKYLKEGEVSDGPDDLSKSVIAIYDLTDKSLDEIFTSLKKEDTKILWAISHDGTLLFGSEIDGKGHPTLTQSQL